MSLLKYIRTYYSTFRQHNVPGKMSAVFKMGGGCPVGIRPIIWMILYKSSTAVRTSVVECRQFSEGTASDNDCWFSAQFGQKIRWRTGRQSNEIKHLNVCGKRFNLLVRKTTSVIPYYPGLISGSYRRTPVRQPCLGWGVRRWSPCNLQSASDWARAGKGR